MPSLPLDKLDAVVREVGAARVPYVSIGATVNMAGGQPISLVFGEDYVPAGNPNKTAFQLTAPVVFVGYGISGLGRDDYKGVDVKGKIVAFFGGAPTSFPAEERAHFGSPSTKAEIAMKKGAVGYISLESPRTGRGNYPFSAVASTWDRPRVTWAEADGSGHLPTPTAPGLGMLSTAAAARRKGKEDQRRTAKRATRGSMSKNRAVSAARRPPPGAPLPSRIRSRRCFPSPHGLCCCWSWAAAPIQRDDAESPIVLATAGENPWPESRSS